MAAKRQTRGVDSARRVLQILLQFSEKNSELTVDNIVDAYQISVPSVYRYLSLLREMNFIEERSKGTYVLSPLILQLAGSAEQSLDYRVEAQPILDDLRRKIGETSLYLRRVNDAAVCLAISETDHAISISFQPGEVMALHAGAGSKILLSSYSKAKCNQYLDQIYPALTDEERGRIEEDLEVARETGYAESRGEVDTGVWACAATVRHCGSIVGALSVATPAYRTDADKRTLIADSVRESAAELEQVLDSSFES